MPYNQLAAQYLRALKPKPTPLTPAGRLPERIACVLFDIYGTLFISGSGDIDQASGQKHDYHRLQSLLATYHIDEDPRVVEERLFRRIKAEHRTLQAKGVAVPEVIIESIWADVLGLDLQTARRFAIEFELIQNPVWPMPHLQQALEACRKSGLLMGVISNAQFFTPYLFEWCLGTSLEKLGFNSDLILWSYQFGIAKPALYLFQLAADRLRQRGILPGAVLYVGNDMLKDIRPAQKVGFRGALFAGDARSLRLHEDHPACKDVTPALVITRLDQLTGHLIG